jgi:hypothetical protein
MISSGEVSQVFAAQNQSFMGQAGYAARIGVGDGGLGAYGGLPFTGIGEPFNYGHGGIGGPSYGGGNRFASNAMAGIGAVGGAASFGSTYLGLAGMAPGFASRFLPFGGFAGTTAGAVAGAGLGIGAMALGSMVHGGQQQMAFNNALGGFGFFNPAARGGMGFTRNDSSALSGMVRQLSEVPEMMTSMEELTRIMGKLRTTGLMQGVKNATDFASRFKEAITTIRETARVLGTTMEEAESFFAHSRSVGFLGRTDQLKNAMNTQLTSGLTGMSVGQVMQLQTGGANMATSMGARRSLGARAATSIAQSIGAAQRSGMVSDELIQDLTGLSGADGVAAASSRMTGLMSQMALGTSAGQFMLAGMTKFVGGRAVLDEDLARKFNSGLISFSDLQHRGMGLSDAQKISFRARQGDLAAGFAGSIGPGGMSRFMGGLTGGRGPEAENLLIQQNGGNAMDADLMRSMRGASSDLEFSQMSKILSRESQIRGNTDPKAILRRVLTKVHAGTFGPLEQAGSEIFSSLGRSYDEFIDDLVGRHVVTMTKSGASALARAMSGVDKDAMNKIFTAAMKGKMPGQTVGGSLGGLFGGRASASQMEHLFGASGAALDAKLGMSATGGGAMATVLDNLKAGNDHFRLLDATDQFDFVRSNLLSKLSAVGLDPSSAMTASDATLSGIAKGSGQVGREAVRIVAAMRGARGPAKDALTNAIMSADSMTQGPKINFSGLYGSDAISAAGNAERVDQMQRDADDGLRKVGKLSERTIQAMKDSPAIRRGVSLAAAGNKAFTDAVWTGDLTALRKMGINISGQELDAMQAALSDVQKARSKGGNVSGALANFDSAQAAGALHVIGQAFSDAGKGARIGAETLTGDLANYGTELESVGKSLEAFGSKHTKETFEGAQSAVRNYVTKIFQDKSLTAEQKAKLIRASGTIGGSIEKLESARRLVGGRYSLDSLAGELGLDAKDPDVRDMLDAQGFTATGKTKLDVSKFGSLMGNLVGLSFARNTGREGQIDLGQGTDAKMLSVLQKIDANQMLIATTLAKSDKSLSDAGFREVARKLAESYLEGEKNR